MTRVLLQKVAKSYENFVAVRDFSLEIKDREFVALVGPSGCGKSTTLRMVAGLEELTSGTITIGDRVVNDLPPRDRNISMVFQNYALYPHMTVKENMSFGLRLVKTPSDVISKEVSEAAAILGLTDKLNRRPGQLSGGERQRVAMGRAMVRRPDVYLFDEPLSNLDAKLRSTMRHEIKKLHRKVKSTIIYVTHDQVEAMTLADRVIIMRAGDIEQVGTPDEVFGNPANAFVAGFIGSPPINFLEGQVAEDGKSVIVGDNLSIPFSGERIYEAAPHKRVKVGIRAEDIVPVGHGQVPTEHWSLDTTVLFAEPLGSETHMVIEFAGQEITARMLDPRPVAPGESFSFNINLRRVHLFDADSGLTLARSSK